ncbi:MAG: mechanosensitive ion channel [Deltaproteobacteria bacterium]|nr:MAG: mechanosensitive ion channel [Deltaproteobacteria bacterium]
MSALLAAVEPTPHLQISAVGIIVFVAVGLGLIGLFQGLRYLLRVSRVSRRRRVTLHTSLTVVETIAGLAYVVSSVPMIFQGEAQYSPYFAVLVVVAVLWISWVAIRDLVHGVFFKAGRTCRPGDRVVVGDVDGRVHRLGYRVLEVTTAQGDDVLVPYSQLARATLTRRAADVGAVRHAFTLAPPPGVPLTAVTEAVELAAFTHHWASAAHPTQVTLTQDGALEVAVFALDGLRGPEIEDTVRAAVKALSEPKRRVR